IRIEPARHRLGLSLRQVDEEPYGYGDEYTAGADVVEAAVGTAPAYGGQASYSDETESNGSDAASTDAGNMSAYGDQPGTGTETAADTAPAEIDVPNAHAPDADEANAQASSVEPSGARPASIAEG